jgi:hypothetical protein
MRKLLSRFKSLMFAPLRRFVVWGDTKFGTSNMKLTTQPRWQNPLDGFADIDEGIGSELNYKLSKDKVNLIGLGDSERTHLLGGLYANGDAVCHADCWCYKMVEIGE